MKTEPKFFVSDGFNAYRLPDLSSALWLAVLLRDLRRWGGAAPAEVRQIRPYAQTCASDSEIFEELGKMEKFLGPVRGFGPIFVRDDSGNEFRFGPDA